MTQPSNGQTQRPDPALSSIGPVAMEVRAWQAPVAFPDGSHPVVLQIKCPLGPLHFIFAPDEAIQIGGQLRQLGKSSKTGLTLPPGVNLNGHDETDGR